MIDRRSFFVGVGVGLVIGSVLIAVLRYATGG